MFALPFAAVLLAGAHQVGESKALGVSPEEGNDGGSAETAQADSLMLVNRTDTAFVALAFHPKTARPLKSNIEVNVREKRASEEPSFYVAAGDSTALWPCDSLGQYENYELHLYRIPGGAEGVVEAPLARSVRLTAERLNAARNQRCRFEIGEL